MRIRWVRHVAFIGEIRKPQEILFKKSEGKK
jgi:hypothetical protein